jgi:hypothetical protein
MIADLEFAFSQHEATVKRAESNARRSAELRRHQAPRPHDEPKGAIAALRRRIAGTAATA